MTMTEVVLKLEYHDEKTRKKAMKIVSRHAGIDSVSLDMNDRKLTVTGDIDPVTLVSKLGKICDTYILSMGAPKAAENKKEENHEKKKPTEGPILIMEEHLPNFIHSCNGVVHNNYMYPLVNQHYDCAVFEEETSYGCVIC
ncbi:hypothetical protein TIFTF001_013740 [Ficus carica]|uniref:HMA domain-containing protein n=1 Tax=Ficus carica TaxID=3494 RepID=A0AA88D6B2_FICCA|nr:hypothetical protein TIFTF001_013740 [Ficus carica]